MDDSASFGTHDQIDINIQHARLLKSGARQSAQLVWGLVVVNTAFLAFYHEWAEAIFWFSTTTFMVLVTLIYAKYAAKNGVNRDTVGPYLKGHIVITFITGCLWGGFAIFTTDLASEREIFQSIFILVIITFGGLMPGAIYRPGYIALAIPVILPFGLHLVLAGEFHHKLVGFAFWVYFAFVYLRSKPVDNVVREGVVAAINKEAAQKIIDQQKEIERLNEARLRLMASVSHDMAQPLMAQRLFLDSLNKRIKDDEGKKLLSRLESVHESQERLLQQLVEHSKDESSEISIIKSSFDLGELLTDILERLSITASEKSIHLKSDLRSTVIYSDPKLIERIVQNLVSNAIKYSPSGSTVEISNFVSEDNVIIEISDDGPGIPEDKHNDIFKEYVRLDRDHRVSGLGLGLSIVRKLAELLECDVALHSELGKGTRFTLKFPENVEAKQTERKVEKTPLLLVIGNNEREEFGGWEELTATWLWQCLVTQNFEDANDMIKALKLKPDLIVLDQSADGYQGVLDFDFSEAEIFRQVPIIMIGNEQDMDAKIRKTVHILPGNFEVKAFHATAVALME